MIKKVKQNAGFVTVQQLQHTLRAAHDLLHLVALMYYAVNTENKTEFLDLHQHNHIIITRVAKLPHSEYHQFIFST